MAEFVSFGRRTEGFRFLLRLEDAWSAFSGGYSYVAVHSMAYSLEASHGDKVNLPEDRILYIARDDGSDLPSLLLHSV